VAIELQMLGWSAVLMMLAFIPGSMAKRRAYGTRWMTSNREPEGLPPITGWGGRAVRAHENLKENFPMFAVAVLMLVLTGKTGMQGTEVAATTFLVARLAHLGAYLGGWFWPRTLAWFTGWVATAYLLVIALS
jgi:uncharacterized MAPEG superfamily protein